MKNFKLWQTTIILGLLTTAPFAAALLTDTAATSGPELGTVAMLSAGAFCLLLARKHVK